MDDPLHLRPWTLGWLAERAVASLVVFTVAWSLRWCFNGLRANQRLALGDAVEMRRGGFFSGGAHEKRALLLPINSKH